MARRVKSLRHNFDPSIEERGKSSACHLDHSDHRSKKGRHGKDDNSAKLIRELREQGKII